MVLLLAWWGEMKKYKHGNPCHEKQKHFSPFIHSFGVIIGRGSLVVLVNFSSLMVAKMYEPILHMQIWVNVQNTIAVASLYSQMIHGSKILSPLGDQKPNWYPSLGLGLAQ